MQQAAVQSCVNIVQKKTQKNHVTLTCDLEIQ